MGLVPALRAFRPEGFFVSEISKRRSEKWELVFGKNGAKIQKGAARRA